MPELIWLYFTGCSIIGRQPVGWPWLTRWKPSPTTV
jgi:hypothetical protein